MILIMIMNTNMIMIIDTLSSPRGLQFKTTTKHLKKNPYVINLIYLLESMWTLGNTDPFVYREIYISLLKFWVLPFFFSLQNKFKHPATDSALSNPSINILFPLMYRCGSLVHYSHFSLAAKN
jgi:hypothetical protein